MSLHGKIALVTGGDRGIGRALATALAQEGADVVLSYLSREDEAREVVRVIESLGRRTLALQADLTSDGETRNLAQAAARLGPIDILVNNAGIAQPRTVEALTPELWDQTFALNLRAAFVLSQEVLPSMRARRFGRLIFISSIAAHVGGIVGPHYAASKAGLIGLMHGYASRLAREGITANVIAPALIETEMLVDNPRVPRPDAVPVGRFGRPEEVADLAVVIAGNGYITGQTLHVNGGMYMT
ncbi:MAG TPA: 3-oxoacyl-ACP reductase family protein [Myxococcaceae bacterium]|nr:3-oxoacyl-ACP reductase family protein [Myxococcaceae bacterium]